MYSGISDELVKIFINLCPCSVDKKTKAMKRAAPVKPIISFVFMQRMQIDLIDFSTHPSGSGVVKFK